MHRLISFYNRNRRTIFIVIFCIIVGFMIIRALNNYYSQKIIEQSEQINNSRSNKTTTTVIGNQGFDLSNTAKTENTIKSDKAILDEFFKYCNEGKTSKAYNMLSADCKEALYPTEQDFKNTYYSKIFNTIKSCIIENWNGDTYRIKYKEDLLSTGKASNSNYMQDYITIVDGEKLSINGFLNKEVISKEEKNEVANITVNYKEVYMDYEIYNVTIRNNTDSDILVDDLQKTDSIYLTESKGAKYSFANYELSKELLNVKSQATVVVNIKFYHTYRSNKVIDSLTFSGIRQINNNDKIDAITINF